MIYSTPVPGVFTSPLTLHLVDEYLSCAAAKELLFSDDIVKPLFIEATREQNFAETQPFFDRSYKPTKIKILIPQSAIEKKDALSDLVFEVFNAKTRFVSEMASRLKEAAAGNLSMDAFARDTEISELKSAEEHSELRKKCQVFKLPPDEVDGYLKDKPLEVALFALDVDCHTDIYRGDWIDLYQASYCAQHPGDVRSCKAKKNALCDMNRVLAMTEPNKKKIYKDRICKMFSNAHPDVKLDSSYQNFFKKNCPEQRQKGKTEL